jgi:hypothetical protein
MSHHDGTAQMAEVPAPSTPIDPLYIQPRECPECKSKSHLIRRKPTPGGEEHTFQCEACKRQATFTVLD